MGYGYRLWTKGYGLWLWVMDQGLWIMEYGFGYSYGSSCCTVIGLWLLGVCVIVNVGEVRVS